MAANETASGPNSVAVTATATGAGSIGVFAKGEAVGIRGDGKTWHGVVGFSEGGFGVYGEGLTGGSGVVGKSKGWHAVGGFSESTTGGAGVYAEATGPGVIAVSKTWHGVYGETSSSTGGAGVWGEHKGGGSGVVGVSHSGAGVYGKGGRVAGYFEGDVEVTGDIRLMHGDCAEDFTVVADAAVEPGTVMVLATEGTLVPSEHAYDKRVAGVISGAGDYKPGIVLDKQRDLPNRQPVALLGKVFCKVDAQFGAIEVGDLLTTSPTTGHAMRAGDPMKAFGAVIGKALRPLNMGQGLIPILIALQ
jgi:hypothetical protein